MNRKLKSVLWGLIFIAVGVVVTLKALDIAEIDAFFKGWWTLFLIVPGVIDLFTEKNKTGALVLILAGVGLLLAERDIIEYQMLWKLILPIALIAIGFGIIYNTFVSKPRAKVIVEGNASRTQTKGSPDAEYAAVFSGEDVNFNGQIFCGTKLTAIFGGVECDLRGAIIDHDVVIEAAAIFGGVDIFLPPTVRVQVENSVSILGGVSNTFRPAESGMTPTVIIRPVAVFGGVEIQ